ncbi:MAG: hypothetical protein CFE26_06735 [Verrucomicrobiales bacterium VVV1]|nr:MAG: hypothetical protein CFE26_06735 [Verrucomicrobiales bacterium VVV1]
MKTRSSSRRRGFTLVELLVVIAIIAVLAAAGFAAGSAAINRAKRTSCLASATALELAINQFYGEYGRLPDVGETVTTDSAKGIELVTILLGKESSSDKMQNPKSLNFLKDLKEGRGKKGGLVYQTGANTLVGLFDPWGNGYEVSLDVEYDEEMTDPTSSGTILRGRRVLVWTKGQNKTMDTPGAGTTPDDIKTW